MKTASALTLLLLINFKAIAETQSIRYGQTLDSSAVNNNDEIRFDSSSEGGGEFNISGTITISNITTTIDNTGTLDLSFGTSESHPILNPTITGDIGSSSKKINNITFSGYEPDLIVGGNIYANSVTGNGILTLNSTSSMNISTDLGSSSDKLDTLNIKNTSDNLTLSGSIYTENFNVENSVTIDAKGDEDEEEDDDFSAQHINISANKTLTINDNEYFSINDIGNIIFGDNSALIAKYLNVARTEGDGLIKGFNDNEAVLTIEGINVKRSIEANVGELNNKHTSIRLKSYGPFIDIYGDLYSYSFQESNASASTRTITLHGDVSNIGKLQLLTDTTLILDDGIATISEITNSSSYNPNLKNDGGTYYFSEAKDYNFNQYTHNSGTLKLKVNNSDKDNPVFAKIIASDDVTIADNSTINFDYSNTGNIINTDNSYEIIETSEDLSINIDNINVTDNSALIKTSIKIDENNSSKLLAYNSYDYSTINNLKGPEGEIIKDSINNNNVPENLKSSLIALSTSEELQNAGKSITAMDHAESCSKTTLITNKNINNITSNNSAISNSFNSGSNISNFSPALRISSWERNFNKKYDNLFLANNENNNFLDAALNLSAETNESGQLFKVQNDKINLWSQIFAAYINQGQRKGATGYESLSEGIAFGGDKEFFKNIYFGGSLSYAFTDVNAASSNTDINTYNISIYHINKDFLKKSFFIKNSLSASKHQYDTERDIIAGSFTDQAVAKFYAMQYTIESKVGKEYDKETLTKFLPFLTNKFSKKARLIPSISLEYTKLMQNAYEEDSLNGSALKVEDSEYENLESTIGINIKDEIKSNKYLIIPEFNIAWSRSLKEETQDSVISFAAGGSDIFAQGIKSPKNTISAGIGLSLFNKNSNDGLSFKYDFIHASNLIGHTGYIQYKKSF